MLVLLRKVLAIIGLVLFLIALFVALAVGVHGSVDHWLIALAGSCTAAALVLAVFP